MSNEYARSNASDGQGMCCATRNSSGGCNERRACIDCEDWYKNYYGWSSNYINNTIMASTDKIICLPGNIPYDTSGSAIGSISGDFWSASEVSSSRALLRYIRVGYDSSWYEGARNSNYRTPFCVGD